mgnify:CR=1 FL=1
MRKHKLYFGKRQGMTNEVISYKSCQYLNGLERDIRNHVKALLLETPFRVIRCIDDVPETWEVEVETGEGTYAMVELHGEYQRKLMMYASELKPAWLRTDDELLDLLAPPL